MPVAQMTLQGRSALVTGGGQGIGRAIVLGLAQCGARVAVADRDLEAAEQVAAEVRSAGGQALALRVDVTDDRQVVAMVRDALQAHEAVDILVNNAGGAAGSSFGIGRVHQLGESDWDTTLALNLKSVFLCTRAVAPSMLERQRGSIVNMASVTGHYPFPGMPAYSAAKAGVISLTRSSALELAPHVRVNALAPGLIETPRTSKNRRPEQLEQLLSNVPLGRMGTPEEVANLAVFLASDAASYINGSVFDCTGGQIWMTEDGRPAFRDAVAPGAGR